MKGATRPRILVVNPGSSSLKISYFDGEAVRARWNDPSHQIPDVDAVAYRFVHGGSRFRGVTPIDDDVLEELQALRPLAPLHQGQALEMVRRFRALVPKAGHYACFDTAFHATLPAAAATYALPKELIERYGIRRFGFHGFSHSWAARRAREFDPRLRRIVTCHLGSGASLAAVHDGTSVDTTMGFTPLEGLVMATRSGDIDPGLLLWLASREPELADLLEHRSGLAGLAGTSDMREVLARDDEDARLALAVYTHRLRKGIAAMAASMGGIDACVFTGGVGENAPQVRDLALSGLEFLGLLLDRRRNTSAVPDAEIHRPDSPARIAVVAAREDEEIARHVGEFLRGEVVAGAVC
ncbi:MAG: acetate/propionate family kinase [Acidothermus sp.]|nr:acetate/propionate family kinase [Acidothermus sp.]